MRRVPFPGGRALLCYCVNIGLLDRRPMSSLPPPQPPTVGYFPSLPFDVSDTAEATVAKACGVEPFGDIGAMVRQGGPGAGRLCVESRAVRRRYSASSSASRWPAAT